MPHTCNSDELPEFQCLLIGSWKNTTELMENNRYLSYNVMPLPQQQAQPHRNTSATYGGFILKNFSFTEAITFNGAFTSKEKGTKHFDPYALAHVAAAPNRGGEYTQLPHAVFYEQEVRFAEGPFTKQGDTPDSKDKPDIDTVVHVENGAWLHLGSMKQALGPYKRGEFVDGQVLPQPPYLTVAKQIAVPHGNSVLALGNVDLNDGGSFKDCPSGTDAETAFDGRPNIPDAFVPYPHPADIVNTPFVDAYAEALNNFSSFENPYPAWTLNPNRPLQLAVEKINPKKFIHWRVTTRPLLGGKGTVTNIPFEERRSEVKEYWADYWLLSERGDEFNYLAYSQTIIIEMNIVVGGNQRQPKVERYRFPHITTNTVKRIPGTAGEAREELVKHQTDD